MKVLILFCGGTLVMEQNEQGALQTPPKERAIQNLLTIEPKLNQIADLNVSYIDNIDSTNIRPEHWDQMAHVIYDNYENYDGFVITHGTDTMAYTSNALSYVLHEIGKPVILTGAQIPGSALESDARRNLINAVRVATMDVSGVMIVFDEEIILGCRASKVSESKLDAFESINWDRLGELRIDIRFADFRKPRHYRAIELHTGFEPNISIITLVPGLPVELLLNTINNKIKGIVLRGYGPGNIAYHYLDAIRRANEREVPVVINTQCREGATLMHLYDVGKKALELGVIQAYDMNIESVATKLMWALKRAKNYHEIKEIMHTNYAGEINKEGKIY